jgi:Fur family transcriptional regulator, stress-responsive regulator
MSRLPTKTGYPALMAGHPDLADRLRRRGWRLTPQRRAIASGLDGAEVHLTAEEVLAAARRTVPEVSMATVYNTLNELVSLGEVRELRLGSGPTRYDPNAFLAHHHLLCAGCGVLHDVRPDGVSALRLARGEQRGFALSGVDVVFRGYCPACRLAGARATGPG